jgi:microcystin degradation protein MlrC
MRSSKRIGVACIIQETNTFAVSRSSIDDFETQGILCGEEMLRLAGTNTEAAGALAEIHHEGAEPVPLLWAWAMSGGLLADDALAHLANRLEQQLRAALPLDALVLSLHGALVAESEDSADLVLLERARSVVGSNCAIGVCLDLHANLTRGLVDASAFVIGYRTYPHVDQADTGTRAAAILIDLVEGRTAPVTRLAKRQMLAAPEAQGDDGPLGRLRRRADALLRDHPTVLDISLFPVQPWLDVPELGFGVTVTTDGDEASARELAELIADEAWSSRRDFAVELVEPSAAIGRALVSSSGPLLLSESSDSPTAGAAGDSPAMVRALLETRRRLRSYVTVVDAAAVDACVAAGAGAVVRLRLGASIDERFHDPVELEATIVKTGNGFYPLKGPVFAGMEVTMGRYARVDLDGLSVLITERPACTFDPETFRQAGLEPRDADVVVVRSANLFRAGWGELSDGAIILDLPGASTPRLTTLDYRRVPRPIYPLDDTVA